MFVETLTAPREFWQQWTTGLRLFSEPPEALVATVAWDIGDGMITSVNVWDNPSAVGDFFVERIQPVNGAEGGPPDYKPLRHGNAVAAYIRAKRPPAVRLRDHRERRQCAPTEFCRRCLRATTQAARLKRAEEPGGLSAATRGPNHDSACQTRRARQPVWIQHAAGEDGCSRRVLDHSGVLIVAAREPATRTST